MAYTRLFIAEKASLAKAVAEVLSSSAHRTSEGFWAAGSDLIIPLSGHIMELCTPDEYSPELKKWSMEPLPFVPPQFKLKVKDDKKRTLEAIKHYLGEVSEVVNLGDPDREGQLLVDEVLVTLKNKKPVKRLFVNSYNEKDILTELRRMSDNKEQYRVYLNAKSRSEADWLFGLNLTRAYTILGRKAGHDGVLSVGRVQTPTLALIVRRDLEIENFVPVDYFTIQAEFLHQGSGHNFRAKLIYGEDQPGLDSEGRLVSEKEAKALVAKVLNQHGAITDYTKKEKKEGCPRSFTLDSLATAASKRGYDLKETGEIAQELYDKYKVTSYPRTDCDYLRMSHHADREPAFRTIERLAPGLRPYVEMARKVAHKSATFNDEKTTAHHGIVPLENTDVSSLPAKYQDFYEVVAIRFLAQFLGDFIYDATSLELKCENEIFRASGRVTKQAGWSALYKEDNDTSLPAMKVKDPVTNTAMKYEAKKTTPPSRWTDVTLSQAMSEIQKYVQNEEYKKRLKEAAGLGTTATREGIIQTIIDRNYVRVRPGKGYRELSSTEIGRSLYAVLPPQLLDPGFTAMLEQMLDSIQEGTLEPEKFLAQQTRVLGLLIDDVRKKIAEGTAQIGNAERCPKCGKGFLTLRKGAKGPFYGCTNYPECKHIVDAKDAAAPAPAKAEGKKPAKPRASTAKTGGSSKPRAAKSSKEPVCPDCGKPMAQRNGAKGAFWGCTGYPACRKTAQDDNGKPKF